MDSFKQPANVIGTANLAGLIGVTYYFYNETQSLRRDLTLVTQQLGAIVSRLNKVVNDETSRTEIVTALRSDLQSVQSTLEEVSTLDTDLEEIVTVLQNNNISVERPSQSEPSPPPRRRHSRTNGVRSRKPAPKVVRSRKPHYSEDDEEEDIDTLIDKVNTARKGAT
jgi:hypothetical protein